VTGRSSGAAELDRAARGRWDVAAAAALFLAAFAVDRFLLGLDAVSGDVTIYSRWSEAVLGGRWPYADVPVDYPPGALPELLLPGLAANHTAVGYHTAFELEIVIVGVLALVLLGRALTLRGFGTRGRRLRLALFALAPVAIGPVFFTRYDLVPATLALAAIVAALAGRPLLAAAASGAGGAAKFFPLLLAPPIALRPPVRVSTAVARLGVAALAALLFAVPFLARGLGELAHVVHRQSTRPLQLESLGGAFFLAAHHLRGWTATLANFGGSENLVNPRAADVARVTSIALVVVLLVVYAWLARQAPLGDDAFVRGFGVVLTAVVVLGRVLSPQYLVWLIAPVLLVRGRRGSAAIALLVASLAATHAWYPRLYVRVIEYDSEAAAWVLVGRDALLVALLAVLAWPARGAPQSSAARSERT
jgi:hypothetical protein